MTPIWAISSVSFWLEIICTDYVKGLAEWTNYGKSVFAQSYYFHCLSSARTAEMVAVKLSLWKSSKQMLEVIVFFFHRHFWKTCYAEGNFFLWLWRAYECLLQIVCVFVCGQAAWEFWYTAMDQCQLRTARQPSSAGQNSPVQRHNAQSSPQTFRFWLGFPRAGHYSSLFLSLSFSFQPLRPNKRASTLKTNTLEPNLNLFVYLRLFRRPWNIPFGWHFIWIRTMKWNGVWCSG